MYAPRPATISAVLKGVPSPCMAGTAKPQIPMATAISPPSGLEIEATMLRKPLLLVGAVLLIEALPFP